jgi:small subunit ribosomal protein S8
MTMTDPIADMLTRLRNAGKAGHPAVLVPRSGIKVQLARLLKAEGYIAGYEEIDVGPQGDIRIHLRYDAARKCVIHGIERVSRPSCREYVGRSDIPFVRNGLGTAVLTTAKGLLTDAEARQAGVGGEVLCHVW